ncbi:hypothetical protein A6U97_08010 [Agrobacterium tumefaciens]|nr:hypothetical protein A6U97_08010 [Agrobacterium tumefaciens]
MYRSTLRSAPLIIFDGNCQAHHLAAIFNASGLARAYCIGEDYGFVPSYRGIGANFITTDEAAGLVKFAKSNGGRAYQASQTTQMQDYLTTEYTGLVDDVIKFPFLQNYAIAPHEFEKVYRRHVEPKRLLGLDIKLMQLVQQKASSKFDFADFFSNAGSTRPLFNTHNHPRGELTAALFLEVCKGIDSISEREASAVAFDLRAKEGINHITVHPVSENVLSDLGYDWGERYAKFRRVIEFLGASRWTEVIEEAQDKSLDLENDSQLLLAFGRASLRVGTAHEHMRLFKRLTYLTPGYIHSWLIRAEATRKDNGGGDWQALLADLRSSLGNGRYYSHTRAWLEIQNGDFQHAHLFAMDYLERTPDRVDAILAITKALSLAGSVESAREIFLQFAKERGEGDVVHLTGFLNDLQELKLTETDVTSARAAK